MVECALCSKSKKGAHLQKNCKKTERKGNVKNVVPPKISVRCFSPISYRHTADWGLQNLHVC